MSFEKSKTGNQNIFPYKKQLVRFLTMMISKIDATKRCLRKEIPWPNIARKARDMLTQAMARDHRSWKLRFFLSLVLEMMQIIDTKERTSRITQAWKRGWVPVPVLLLLFLRSSSEGDVVVVVVVVVFFVVAGILKNFT